MPVSYYISYPFNILTNCRMKVLNEIIELMNKEEVRHFKLFSARTQTSEPRKDLLLFDYMRKNTDDYDEEKIFQKLYSGKSKNAFYRLKNRLLSDLNKSLNLQHLEDDDILHLFHLLSLGRLFHSRNKYQVARHYVRKAEKKAISLDSYELLDFIYSEMIKLSHEITFINPEEYIEKRKANQKKLTALREIEDILAAVIYRVKMTQNFSSHNKPLFDLLQKTVSEFTENNEVKQDPKLRFTIYQAVSRILAARKEFDSLEAYVLKTYEEFREEGLFNKANHDVRLQMLVFIVNTLYNTAKYDLSLQFTDQLHSAMEEYGRVQYDRFLPYYYNSLIINNFKTDLNRSIEILEEVIQKRYFKDAPYNEFVYITNLAICYWDTDKFKKCLKTLVQAKIHDGFIKVSPAFRMRIAITEITSRIEISDFEVAERQIEEVRRDFKELLSEESNAVGRELLELLKSLNDSFERRLEPELQDRIRRFLKTYDKQMVDNYSLIKYHIWLGRKIGLEAKPIK